MTIHQIAVGDLPGFKMDLDPSFAQDRTLIHMFKMGILPEPEVIGAMMRIVREKDVVIDGGASNGFFTCLLASLVGDGGKVMSYEPSRQAFKRLKDNVEINNFEQVLLSPQILWSDETTVDFTETLDTGLSHVANTAAAPSTYTASATKLNRPARLIKLDIEGSEYEALTSRNYDGTPYIVCELNEMALHRAGRSQDALRQLMRDRGYQMWQLFPDGTLPRLVPYPIALHPKAMNVNVLFAAINDMAMVWKDVDG
jgi:FkbM family methyltransferase